MFKGIFSDESKVLDFLTTILVGKDKVFPEGTKFEELQFIKNECIQNRTPDAAKKIIFDLQIKTNHGRFIVEMLKQSSKDYLKRVEFYSATAYSDQQIRKPSKSSMSQYSNALPLVVISLIKDKTFGDIVPCVSYHINMEKKTQKSYMKAFTYVFIELAKFNDNRYDQSNIDNVNEEE